jgi:cyclase
MIRPRIIPCLLLKGKGLVKTTQFKNPVYLGDPINVIKIFNEKMVDELIILDIDASNEGVSPNFELLQRITSISFSPLTYGGGVKDLDHAERLFTMGFEKLSLNSAAFENPSFVSSLSKKYGNQSVVVSVNIFKDFLGKKRIVSNSLKNIKTKYSIIDQLIIFQDLGAGEILINDVSRDGMMQGYDIEFINQITSKLSIPVIVNGGCGSYDHIRDVIKYGGASASAVGSFFVFNGKRKAVLISYPDNHVIKNLLL